MSTEVLANLLPKLDFDTYHQALLENDCSLIRYANGGKLSEVNTELLRASAYDNLTAALDSIMLKGTEAEQLASQRIVEVFPGDRDKHTCAVGFLNDFGDELLFSESDPDVILAMASRLSRIAATITANKTERPHLRAVVYGTEGLN